MADGTTRMAIFQAAPVRKPLIAVFKSFDLGRMCLFDDDGSYIIERDNPKGWEIRRGSKQCIANIVFERKNGVHTLPT